MEYKHEYDAFFHLSEIKLHLPLTISVGKKMATRFRTLGGELDPERLSGFWNCSVYAQMYNTPFHLAAFTLQGAEAKYSERHQWAQSIETPLLVAMPSYFICSWST